YIARQDNSTYVYYVMPENLARFTEQQFSLTFNKELYKWWETSATAYGFGIQYEGVYNAEVLDVSGWGYGLNCSGTFRLGNQWKTSYWMNFTGKSRETAMAVADSNIYYGISVSKKILNDTTLVKLDVVDPFHLYDYRLNVRLQDVDTQLY